MSSDQSCEIQKKNNAGGGDDLPLFSCPARGDRPLVRELLPKRDPKGHKGTFGKVLCFAGSRNMAGAALLAGKAAYRSGCGMVRILSPEANRIILQSALPEALFAPLDDDKKARKAFYAWADVILFGPGCGMGPDPESMLKEILSGTLLPLVIDADGLNLIAGSAALRKLLKKTAAEREIILTPHPAELSRLLKGFLPKNAGSAPVSEDPAAAAHLLADESGCIVVAKSDRTLVITSGKEQCFSNEFGNSGMATAGSGDVLAGCIAGLLAQGLGAEDAAIRGVMIHSLAGDYVAEQRGEHAVMASDIAENIGREPKRSEGNR